VILKGKEPVELVRDPRKALKWFDQMKEKMEI